MKVLLINVVNGILSTGRNCFEISDVLNKKGIECWTVYSYGTTSKNSVCISSKIECKFHAFMSRLTGKQGYYSYFSTKKLIGFIKKEKPDVVHLNNLHGNFVNIKTLLQYLGSIGMPTVVTLHDCWFYTGKCTHYTSIACYKWENGCNCCPKLKCDHNSWFFDRTQELWKDKLEGFRGIKNLAVVGVSDWITNEARKSPFFSDAKIIQRIYNWIDLEVFRTLDVSELKKKYFGDKKVYLGIASKWDNRKGLDKYISLSEKLTENEVIVLIGDADTDILPLNVINIPKTNDICKLVEYYNMADVLIQFSEEESFGKVVAEALACGTPVLTNNKTANPELVPESCGIVVDVLDAGTVYKAIQEINSRNDFCCRQFAINHFDKNTLINEHIELYYRLISMKD